MILPRTAIMVVTLTIVSIFGFMFVGCASESSAPDVSLPVSAPTTSPVTAPTTFPVTLFCPECADAGMKINLWASPNRAGVAGSVPHNTRAIVIETSIYDGVLHYKVQANGITGWVSQSFIQR